MIVIVDYGVGNLGSILNMLKKAGAEAVIASDPESISQAKKLILPGVGSFDFGMQQLNNSGLTPILNKKILEEKTPILGICLGMQLFTKSSEEGHQAGLGWIDAETVKFKIKPESKLKIPHMGWNNILLKKRSKLLEHLPEDPRYYFVHSYHVQCNNVSDVLVTAEYGYEFTCGVEKENILGVQFHPEKSHKFGLTLFENFNNNY